MHRWANMHSHSDAQVWMHTWINTELHFTFCYKHTDPTLDQKQTHRWQTLGLTNGMNKPSLMLTVAAFSCHSKHTTSEGFTQCWKDNTMTRLTVWTTQGSLLFPVASRHSEQSYKAELLNISLCERAFLSWHWYYHNALRHLQDGENKALMLAICSQHLPTHYP